MAMLRGSRYQLDVAGHYGRPDVFDFAVRDAAHATSRGVPALVDGRSRREVDPMASDPLVEDAPVG
ncbi:MAG: hypothetical protein U5K81_10095 [Trueperaceae bacterium]|nr:hypothetical protein [Trueperaceae bacterium]